MAHFDFREALSTPEEKIFTTAANAASIPAVPPAKSTARDLVRGIGFTRSTWTNIVFVAIASIGGLVCAFYFFNGGELLRAAASWPSEYLYPRPVFGDRIAAAAAEQSNPADQFGVTNETASSSKIDEAKNLFDRNPVRAEFAPLAGTTAPITPPSVTGPPPIITILPPPVPPPPPPPTSLLDTLTNDVNTVVTGGDALIESFYQSATSDRPVSATVRTTKQTIKSTKRKVSTSKQKAVATATRSANSTARSLQQTTSQTQMTQMSMSTVRPLNQVMSSGGMGGMGGLGGAGAGAGTGGVTGGAVGGALGGLGGISGGGLGGTISGVGGTVGGVVGGHH
jgi:hypothetical protein